MEKSAVFFDIDGTLWDRNNFIPESTKEAIKLLTDNGHLAFINTGRSRAFVFEESLLSMAFSGYCCACGCHIELDGRMVYEYLLDEKLVEQTVDYVKSCGFRPIVEGPQYLYFDEEDYKIDDEYGNKIRRDMKGGVLPLTPNKSHLVANKMSCATNGLEEAYRDKCLEKLEDKYDFVIHNELVFEMVPKGFTKAKAIEKVCELFDIDQKNTYAFGDGENDLQMLEFAHTGICMGNGSDRAKQTADYITEDLYHDGIYKGLKKFNLI